MKKVIALLAATLFALSPEISAADGTPASVKCNAYNPIRTEVPQRAKGQTDMLEEKDRLVPLSYISSLFLDDYLSQCPYSNTAYVFVDRLGRPLSGNAVRVFVNRLQKKLPFDLSSHKLRHNFATNYCVDNLRKNGNSCVYDLSILMGHESMETTKKYEHFAHEILAAENNHSHLDQVFQV